METEIYLLTEQVDFNFFSCLVSEGPSAPSFLKIELSFCHFLQSKQVKRTPPPRFYYELIIWKMNPLVVPVTGVKFKSELLHA